MYLIHKCYFYTSDVFLNQQKRFLGEVFRNLQKLTMSIFDSFTYTFKYLSFSIPYKY